MKNYRYATLFFSVFLIFTLISLDSQAGELTWKRVPAEESGLTHIINSDPEGMGSLNYPWMSPLVDINGDDHLDILYYGHHGGGAAIWFGLGNGRFVLDRKGYTNRWVFGARDPVWWDWNGDGILDGIGTEGNNVKGWLYQNNGKGYFTKTNLKLLGMLVDLDDGLFEETWNKGSFYKSITPPIRSWGIHLPANLQQDPAFHAETIVGWPLGVNKGSHPLDPKFIRAFSVDLTGNHQNELIIQFCGRRGNVHLYSWVLAKTSENTGFHDVTENWGLPTGSNHAFFPEDIDTDGDLDIMDLRSGQWLENNGSGQFQPGPHRMYASPEKLGKRAPWNGDGEYELIDLDNNGLRDLILGGDHDRSHGVYLNQSNSFKLHKPSPIGAGRRMRKFGDVDEDGDIDLVRIRGEQVELFLNQTSNKGFYLKLVPEHLAEAHLGTKVWVWKSGHMNDKKELIHYRQGFMERQPHRSNVLSPILHIGTGQVTTVDIRVRFPGGNIQERRNVPVQGTITIEENI